MMTLPHALSQAHSQFSNVIGMGMGLRTRLATFILEISSLYTLCHVTCECHTHSHVAIGIKF